MAEAIDTFIHKVYEIFNLFVFDISFSFLCRKADFKSPNTNINGILVTDKHGLILASMSNEKSFRNDCILNVKIKKFNMIVVDQLHYFLNLHQHSSTKQQLFVWKMVISKYDISFDYFSYNLV